MALAVKVGTIDRPSISQCVLSALWPLTTTLYYKPPAFQTNVRPQFYTELLYKDKAVLRRAEPPKKRAVKCDSLWGDVYRHIYTLDRVAGTDQTI